VFLEYSEVLSVMLPLFFLLVMVLYGRDVQLLGLCCVLMPNPVDITPSEVGQLTETCKGIEYIQLNHTGRC
jgi:hypothetical protein